MQQPRCRSVVAELADIYDVHACLWIPAGMGFDQFRYQSISGFERNALLNVFRANADKARFNGNLRPNVNSAPQANIKLTGGTCQIMVRHYSIVFSDVCSLRSTISNVAMDTDNI